MFTNNVMGIEAVENWPGYLAIIISKVSTTKYRELTMKDKGELGKLTGQGVKGI